MFIPDISSRSGPKYMALADAFAEAIESSELEAHAKLPPQRILSYRLGVTVGTVTRAYQELEHRGLVAPKVGSGTYVKDRHHESRAFYHPVTTKSGIDLAICRPLLINQQQHLSRTLQDLSLEPIAQRAVLDYCSAEGLQGHNQTLQHWLGQRFKYEMDSRRLLWTYGGQHGLSVLVQALTRPKETILVEGLCYPEFLHSCQQSERKLVPIRLDAQGIIPEDLELQCQRHKPRLLYLTPAIQNPTGACLSDSRRLRVIEICRRHQVLIIEDDVLYCPPEHRRTPLVAIAPDITLFVGSFSKYFSGGLRVGYIIMPRSLSLPMQRALRASCMHISPLMIDLVCRWLTNGAMDAVDQEIAAELKARHRILQQIFPGAGHGAVPGFNVWIPLPAPLTGRQLSHQLKQDGVHVREAEMFAVDHYPAPAAIRVSLTGPTSRTQLKSGLEVIRTQIQSASAHAEDP
ncbi:PLP-dependent aminotransferase family protein [Photobacterium sp. MCCC 1A19761]|uniref:aminotransferase-like domain-containing protein n=1 Tax=Photobacterium sp. MCCC 1A19761 TaxID=3115000 RepID=UPI00307E519E